MKKLAPYVSVNVRRPEQTHNHRNLDAALKKAHDFGLVLVVETGQILQSFEMSNNTRKGIPLDDPRAEPSGGNIDIAKATLEALKATA
ncbi:VOC family protein [Ferrimonas marina]|uniref:Uncharacterized protein n=1 Tax=Ferrimonas marina TaxID=299255 RepID=A0A1M5U2Q6_9GAMM|nr:hypothetical protein [Ferrimonas marina]SHH57244.1 hypothetical protein SAMN02745129_2381 [Ferrimonas marina]